MQSYELNPWRLVSRLNRDIDRLRLRDTNARRQFVPAVDIDEDETRFVVRADLPGVDPAAIDIRVDQDLLTLEGVREPTRGDAKGTPRHAERVCGRFQRAFRLPDTASGEGVTAEYRNGVLTISIPKAQESVPYRIEVTAH